MKKFVQLFIPLLFTALSGFAQTATNKLDSTGDVGVGTLSPITKLEAKGAIFSSNQANDAGVYMSGEDGGYGLLQATNNYNSVAKNLILQKYGGNVGIGTTSPALSLSVGTTLQNDGVRIGGGTYRLDIMTSMTGGAYHPLVTPNDVGIIFKGNGINNAGGLVIAPWGNQGGGLRMDNTGKIGIWTDPVALMTLRGGQNVANNMQDAENYTVSLRPDYNSGDSYTEGIAFGGNNSYTHHVSASIYHVQQGAPSYGDLVFATRPNGGSLAERLRINSTGSVGIGTVNMSDSSYKLYVEKGVRTRKVKVDQTAWADYVFNPSYQLPSLKEVENYIQQHKHLPDVPSAEDVEKNGLDLGENQATLLKKIEELTLYVIELRKQVDRQQKQIAELKKGLNQE